TRQAGVPVLLTGQGADEVFGGYESALYAYLGSRFRSGRSIEGLTRLREGLALGSIPLKNIAIHALPPTLGRWARRKFLRARLDWVSPEFAVPSRHVDNPTSPDMDPIND